jgi:hypothetical protein
MMGRIHVGGLVAAAVVGVLGAVTMAAPPPKKQPIPATMTFRCFEGEPGSPSCLPVSDATDRVRDDGGTYTGGNIDTGGVFNVGFVPGTRILNLYLGTRIPGSRTCITTGNCHPLDLEGASLALDYFDVRVKPLTADGSQDLAGGLYAMTACNAPYPALVHYTFWFPDGNGHWGLNFNPKAYPDTTAAVLVRLTDTKWTVEAMAMTNDIAELLSWGHTGITRHNGPSHEGRFRVRFKLAIDIASLPAGAAGCTL